MNDETRNSVIRSLQNALNAAIEYNTVLIWQLQVAQRQARSMNRRNDLFVIKQMRHTAKCMMNALRHEDHDDARKLHNLSHLLAGFSANSLEYKYLDDIDISDFFDEDGNPCNFIPPQALGECNDEECGLPRKPS